MSNYYFVVLNRSRTAEYKQMIESVDIYKAYEQLLVDIDKDFDILQIEFSIGGSREIHNIREFIS